MAEAKGYKLDDHGLYPVVRDEHGNRVSTKHFPFCCFSFLGIGSNASFATDCFYIQVRKKVCEFNSIFCLLVNIFLFFSFQVKSGASVPCKSEREIFDTLGFPWLEPHARNL